MTDSLPSSKWDYMIDVIDTKSVVFDIGELLIYHGQQGWELVTVVWRPDDEELMAFFKKEIK